MAGETDSRVELALKEAEDQGISEMKTRNEMSTESTPVKSETAPRLPIQKKIDREKVVLSTEKEADEKEDELFEQIETRKSHVETICDSDEEINYTFTALPVDDFEEMRSELVYRLGVSEILVPKLQVVNGSDVEPTDVMNDTERKYVHALGDVGALAGKTLIFFFNSSRFTQEHRRKKDLKDILSELVLNTCDFNLDVESNENKGQTKKNDFAVVYVSRDKNEDEFEKSIANYPFFAIPYGKKSTTRVLASSFNVDGPVLSQRRQRLIVYSLEHGVIDSWGKSALLYNHKQCVELWRKGKPGITVAKALSSRYLW